MCNEQDNIDDEISEGSMDFFIPADEEHVARETRKAAELRKSQWWKNELAKGKCHYCGGRFKPSELTMDHIVPVARGGKSTRGNVVAACLECNRKKKYLTPVEMVLRELEAPDSPPESPDAETQS